MKHQRGISVLLLLVIIIAAIGGGLWYHKRSKQQEAEARAEAYNQSRKALQSQIEKWLDALKLAESSSRVALPGPVKSLQDIKRETSALAGTPCMIAARDQATSGMTLQIDGFLLFMQGNEHELDAAEKLTAGAPAIVKAIEMADACKPL